jgi:Tfp pilus assembly protein PilX
MNMKKFLIFGLKFLGSTERGVFGFPLKTKNVKLKTNRGFTLLLAALISSVVLTLAGSIFTIAQKQVTLSSLGRDSQFAFYAADTGAECALYWDIRYSAFSTISPGVTPSCDGQVLSLSGQEETPPYTVTFQTNLFTDASNGYCVDVAIEKNTSNPFTVIHADGYSVPCAALETSTRALQRSIELRY